MSKKAKSAGVDTSFDTEAMEREERADDRPRVDLRKMTYRQQIAYHHRKEWIAHSSAHPANSYPEFASLGDDQILALVDQVQRKERDRVYGIDRGPHASGDLKPGVCFCSTCFAEHLRLAKLGVHRA